ncbi:PAS domain-containing protein [Carnobacterium funditum]
MIFVDKDDRVRFYSVDKDWAFARTESIIGREVIHCLPPKVCTWFK